MNLTDVVVLIGNVLTQLDTALMSSDLNAQPAKWQQLCALRNHLDDQQRLLVKVDIESDDAGFQTLAGTIATATKQLNQQIADMTKIDSIINIISQISADADSILKLV